MSFTIYVDSGLTNGGERIDGLNTEAYLTDEGLDRYDIRTYLLLPGDDSKKHIKLRVLTPCIKKSSQPKHTRM